MGSDKKLVGPTSFMFAFHVAFSALCRLSKFGERGQYRRELRWCQMISETYEATRLASLASLDLGKPINQYVLRDVGLLNVEDSEIGANQFTSSTNCPTLTSAHRQRVPDEENASVPTTSLRRTVAYRTGITPTEPKAEGRKVEAICLFCRPCCVYVESGIVLIYAKLVKSVQSVVQRLLHSKRPEQIDTLSRLAPPFCG